MTKDLSLRIDSPSGEVIATLILAHGAGAPMDSEFMNQLATDLCREGVKVIRFEFPYMQQRRVTGSKRPPDRQPQLLDCWRQVVAQVERDSLGQGPLLIGGKSMGGRMASLIVDEVPVAGVCCFGFPFFPKRKDGLRDARRVAHLEQLATPCLIVQGTRDPFGTPEVVDTLKLSAAIDVVWLDDGDHDFKPRVRSGLTQAEHLQQAATRVGDFSRALLTQAELECSI